MNIATAIKDKLNAHRVQVWNDSERESILCLVEVRTPWACYDVWPTIFDGNGENGQYHSHLTLYRANWEDSPLRFREVDAYPDATPARFMIEHEEPPFHDFDGTINYDAVNSWYASFFPVYAEA